MAGSPRQINTVIFDLDDTLIDWSDQAVSWPDFLKPRTENIRQYLVNRGIQLPPADDFYIQISQAISLLWDLAKKTQQIQSIDEMLQSELLKSGSDISDIDMKVILKKFDWGPFPGVCLFDDTLPVLNWLTDKGYKIGLLTNSFLPMWMRDIELESYGLLDFFDARLTAADVGCIKPHPKIYEKMLDSIKSDPHSSMFVGDRPSHDIAGANSVGLQTVLITPPHVNFELDGVVPDFAITKLSQLPPILQNLAETDSQ